jgi:hypothetical protein
MDGCGGGLSHTIVWSFEQTLREPEKLDYKMNADLARLFYDTINIIAPSIAKTAVDPDGADANKPATHIKNSRGQWYAFTKHDCHSYAISQQAKIGIQECPEAENDMTVLHAALAAIPERHTIDRRDEPINRACFKTPMEPSFPA